jgi:hypothetical protein
VIYAPKAATGLSPGFTLGLVKNKRFALKGLKTRTRSGSKVPSRLSPYLTAPSGLIPVGRTTQGKPWATLFRLLRATDWTYDRRGELSENLPSDWA